MNRVFDQFKALLLDAYGIFWGGNAVGILPGAKERMQELVTSGKIVGILSNTTQLRANEIEKFRKAGLIQGVHFHFFVSSGEVTKDLFKTFEGRYALFCEAHPRFSNPQLIFEKGIQTPHLTEAEFIYITPPHIEGEDRVNPEDFIQLVENFVESGLPMVCSNPDRFAHEGNPPQAFVRQGTIADFYEQRGGKVMYIGKPHPDVYTYVMKEFAAFGITHASDVLMVGDTPETDIRGAKNHGMQSALVTSTGIMGDRVHKIGLKQAIDALNLTDQPNFFIESFANDQLSATS